MGQRKPLGRRRRRLLWTVAILGGAAIVGTVLAVYLYRLSRPEGYVPGAEPLEITSHLSRDLPEDAPQAAFHDVTDQAGLGGFRQFHGERSSQLPEDMGSGAAWGDFDADGDEDLFVVAAGGDLGDPPAKWARSVLYENSGDGTFLPSEIFPELRIIGMGAAWGDYDGDGRIDLAVTGYRSLRLFRNSGDRFERVGSFPEPDGFWSGLAWGDFDNDRDLDLYVCGYVRYREADSDRAGASLQYGRSVPYTLNPASFPPERNLLFRNRGDGTFVEEAAALGLDNPEGRSLGALWHDFDDDGWLDLYVANDISDNVFFRNRGGKFEEISHAAWIADYRGAMGLAAGDWNRDGDFDLFITHWVAQENALYDSLFLGAPAPGGDTPRDGSLRFIDVADRHGLGQPALQSVGWGVEFADFDADGWLDLVVANGSTFETDSPPRKLIPQPPFFFWNRRGKHFFDLAPASDLLSVPHVSRGLALADYDNDGDQDILLVHHAEGIQLLRNDMQAGNWLQVRLRNRKEGERTGAGSIEGVRLTARVGERLLRRAAVGPSYLSQSSRILHFGLGDARGVDRLVVEWPGGGRQEFADLAGGIRWEVTEGEPVARKVPRIARTDPPPAGSGVTAGTAPGDERARLKKFWEVQRAAVHAMKVENDPARAAGLFREALLYHPGHEDSRYYLANCLDFQGDREGAEEQLRELIRINPQSHRAYKQLGILRARWADSPSGLSAATEVLEQALALNPEETGVLQVLGEIDLIRGDRDSARERFVWIGRTNPQAIGAFFLRGYLAWGNGDTDGARRLLASAVEAAGGDWTPKGTTSEGDVRTRMHIEETPLSRFWEEWSGDTDPATAFHSLDLYLKKQRASIGFS